MHIFHALFTHAQGGLGQSHLNTTEALASKGHKVTALMHKDSPYVEGVQKFAAIERFQPMGFYDLLTAWKIRRLIQKERPDVIMAHNARAIALMSCAARGTGVKVVGVSHSYKTARTSKADVLVLLSPHMRDHFVAAGYKGRSEVIPNLIRLPKKFTGRPRHEPILIGAIGRFTPEKGFQDFIQTLHELKELGGKFKARIGGDGEDAAALKAQAEQLGLANDIEFIGWVKDAPAFYSDLDILCVPSREESFPLVILEAFAYGAPVVATDAPGPAAMITPGVDGVIVPRRDTKAMAAALLHLIPEPETTAKMREMGWKHVQQYDLPAVAGQWDALLRSVISEAPSARVA